MKILQAIASTTIYLLAHSLPAAMPPMPPMTNGDGNPANNGMKHILVDFDPNTQSITLHVDAPPVAPVTMTSGIGMQYDAQFGVLDDQWFNSQYGWVPGGIIVPPSGLDIWIARTGFSGPTGGPLNVYEGGRGATTDSLGNPLPDGMPNWTMQPLYQADGDRWRWDRIMQHDLYVASLPGTYSMSFEVYLGDSVTGAPEPGYGSGTTTLSFVVPVPSPTGLALCWGPLSLLVPLRRR